MSAANVPQPKVKRFVGARAAAAVAPPPEGDIEDGLAVERKAATPTNRAATQVPDDILNDIALNQAIAQLPKNYGFELHKTVWRLRKEQSKRVALQFPEGLLMYACTIAQILERYTF